MTWYLVVVEHPPRIEIDTKKTKLCIKHADKERYVYPGNYVVYEGDKLKMTIYAKNVGGKGKVACQIYDYDNKAQIYWNERNVKEGEEITEEHEFTVPENVKSMRLEVIFYYWDEVKLKWEVAGDKARYG